MAGILPIIMRIGGVFSINSMNYLGYTQERGVHVGNHWKVEAGEGGLSIRRLPETSYRKNEQEIGYKATDLDFL